MAIKRFAVILAAMLPLLVAGCVFSSGSNQAGASSTAGDAAVARGSQPIMIVDGENIFPADLMAFPAFRNPLRAYIYRISLAQAIKQAGVTVSDDKLNERVEAEKDVAAQRQQSWEDYLADMNYTEEEFIAEKKDELLLDALIAQDIDTSDEALKQFYDANKEDTLKRYFKKYYMPEAERDKVTFDDVKDFVRDLKLQKETFPVRNEKIREIINNATLKILCFDSKELNEHYEDLILNDVRDRMNEKAEEAKANAAGAAGSVAPQGQ